MVVRPEDAKKLGSCTTCWLKRRVMVPRTRWPSIPKCCLLSARRSLCQMVYSGQHPQWSINSCGEGSCLGACPLCRHLTSRDLGGDLGGSNGGDVVGAQGSKVGDVLASLRHLQLSKQRNMQLSSHGARAGVTLFQFNKQPSCRRTSTAALPRPSTPAVLVYKHPSIHCGTEISEHNLVQVLPLPPKTRLHPPLLVLFIISRVFKSPGPPRSSTTRPAGPVSVKVPPKDLCSAARPRPRDLNCRFSLRPRYVQASCTRSSRCSSSQFLSTMPPPFASTAMPSAPAEDRPLSFINLFTPPCSALHPQQFDPSPKVNPT